VETKTPKKRRWKQEKLALRPVKSIPLNGSKKGNGNKAF
jgi:hypothetical protein